MTTIIEVKRDDDQTNPCHTIYWQGEKIGHVTYNVKTRQVEIAYNVGVSPAVRDLILAIAQFLP